MSQSKASRDREMKRRMKNRRHTSREQILPGKVEKEQKRFDRQYFLFRTQVERSFPDPTDRLNYINSLLAGLLEPSQEIRAVETGRSSATELNPSNTPKEITSEYAVVEETMDFDEETES